MKSNLRLRVLIPTAVLALLGMAAFAFAFSGTPEEEPRRRLLRTTPRPPSRRPR